MRIARMRRWNGECVQGFSSLSACVNAILASLMRQDRRKPIWQVFRFALRPEIDQCRQQILELEREIGYYETQAALGLPSCTIDDYKTGRRNPDSAARKLIWLVHSMILHPGRLQTVQDLMTWGRFLPPEKEEK